MVNVNGRLADSEHAVISVFDHDFLYGEGVYEVLRRDKDPGAKASRPIRRKRRSDGGVGEFFDWRAGAEQIPVAIGIIDAPH